MAISRFFLHDNIILTWCMVGLFSAWGGIVRYLIDNKGRELSIKEGGCQVMISLFTGLLGGIYSYEYDASNAMIFFISGICSTLGSSLLKLLWKQFIIKVDGKP